MPRYTRARFLCSCGHEYSRDGFRNHRYKYPSHHEMDRYTFGRQGGRPHLANGKEGSQ